MITVKMGGGSSLKLIANAIGDPASPKDKKEKLAEIIDNAQTDIAELCNERGCSIPAHPTFPQIIGGISKLTHFTKPAQVSGLRSVGNHDTANKIDLFWTNPAGDSNFRGVKILYKTGGYPSSPTDGTVAYDGTGTSAYLTSMAHGTTYYFRAFSYSSVDGGFVYNDLAIGAQCTGASTLNTSAQITGLRATVGSTTSGYVKLTWANPSDSKFKGVRILYKTGGYPSSPTDGTVLYTGTGTSVEKTGLANGTTYYFRAFAYNLSNNIYSYNTGTSGAQCSEVPFISRGQQVFTSSGTFTVPARVSKVDVFLVGGGGSGESMNIGYPMGGAGGYTKTYKNVTVVPGNNYSIVVGSLRGTTSAFGYSAAPGHSNNKESGNRYVNDGGGSGGGACGRIVYNGETTTTYNQPGAGGIDGGNGGNGYGFGSIGQGTTTRAFGEASGTLYASGGKGGGYHDSKKKTYSDGENGNKETNGNGIVIVRWGY